MYTVKLYQYISSGTIIYYFIMCEINLLDPSISSIEFNTEKTHNHILESNNPDKQMEYFWLTFKDSIISHIGEANRLKITNFSDKLNVLKENKKYEAIKEEISNYMKNNIGVICEFIIKSKKFVAIMHLHTNITRWKNIDESFQHYIENSVLVNFVFVLSKMYKKQHTSCDKVLNYVIENYVDGNDAMKKKEFFEYSVKNNLCLVTELLLPDIDLRLYFKDEVSKYKNLGAKKLIKKLAELIN